MNRQQRGELSSEDESEKESEVEIPECSSEDESIADEEEDEEIQDIGSRANHQPLSSLNRQIEDMGEEPNRHNVNFTTEQDHVSRFVYYPAIFRWKIENFSVDNIPENKFFEYDDIFVVSPCYKYLNIDWNLKLCCRGESLYLSLSTHETNNLPQIHTCEFIFHTAPNVASYKRKYTEPSTCINIKTHLPKNTIMDHCVVDGALTVSCELMTKEFINLPPKTETTRTEKERSAQGRSTLAVSIGSILDDAKFSDISLKIGEDTFRAHRAILASRSKVFQAMFESGMKESQEGVVQMVDMKPFTAKEMLQYIYTGEIDTLSMDRAMDLYACADRYDLQELRWWCKDFIVEHVTADEVCDLALLADLHDDKELAKVVKSVFKRECETVLGSQTWREFAKDNPSVYMDLVEFALLKES